MYAMSTASTTTSGSRADMTAGMMERRVRVVRLLRPRKAAPAFGFSLRGGREYATGFFISKVELNSEAHLQGLKVSLKRTHYFLSVSISCITKLVADHSRLRPHTTYNTIIL